MILITHLIIAFFSIGVATYLYFSPTESKLKLNYVCMALTFGSGTYLLWTTKTHILQGCVLGLAYLAGAGAATILASKKLADQKVKN